MSLNKRLITALLTALLLAGVGASSAAASTSQQSILTDPAVLWNPGGVIAQAKQFGFTMVKVPVVWNQAAPGANSTRIPKGFNPSNAATYSKAYISKLDAIVKIAAQNHISVGFQVSGGIPLWAQAKGGTSGQLKGRYRPSSGYYGDFVKALGSRYKTVSWWSVWNEPNYGTNLAPEISGSFNGGAVMYRGLVNAAYNGLRASGHNPSRQLVIGELAPRYQAGSALGGERPLQFLDNLYCVNSAGKRLSGSSAKAYGCSKNFRGANPGLFNNAGLGIHPYGQGTPPNQPTYTCGKSACHNGKKSDPNYADFAELGRLAGVIDRNDRANGSSAHMPLWNSEFGYWTTGANEAGCHFATEANCAVSPTTAAYYDNWSEYLSYRNGRVVSFDQYQLADGGTWPDGLFNAKGAKKPLYGAFQLPLFTPSTTPKKGALSVWGGLRAASSAKNPSVNVQFAPKHGSWKTLTTVSKFNSRGYFTVTVHPSGAGSIRLQSGSLTSRTQAIK